MKFRNRICRLWIVVVFTPILLAVVLAAAQGRKQPVRLDPNNSAIDSQQSGASEKNDIQASPSSSLHEPVQAGSETSAGDENAEFKNSASVKWLARKLGVSTGMAYQLSVALNFLTIVALTVLLLRSKLPALFRDRSQFTRQALDEARKASAEAQQRLSAIESRLGKLRSEIAAMQSAAEQESEAEEEHIRAAAEEEKRKIVEAAGQEITAAVNLARRELKTYAADLAVTVATKRIRVDASTDEGLLLSFIDQLGPNGSN